MNAPLVTAAIVAATALLATAAQAAPAVSITEGQCGLIDAAMNTVISDRVQLLRTQSPTGVITFRCQASEVGNDTGRAVVYNFANTGFQCALQDPLGGVRITDDWQLTVSPSGQATLSCRDRL